MKISARFCPGSRSVLVPVVEIGVVRVTVGQFSVPVRMGMRFARRIAG